MQYRYIKEEKHRVFPQLLTLAMLAYLSFRCFIFLCDKLVLLLHINKLEDH